MYLCMYVCMDIGVILSDKLGKILVRGEPQTKVRTMTSLIEYDISKHKPLIKKSFTYMKLMHVSLWFIIGRLSLTLICNLKTTFLIMQYANLKNRKQPYN